MLWETRLHKCNRSDLKHGSQIKSTLIRFWKKKGRCCKKGLREKSVEKCQQEKSSVIKNKTVTSALMGNVKEGE